VFGSYYIVISQCTVQKDANEEDLVNLTALFEIHNPRQVEYSDDSGR
jgi:hypothetical protein